MCRFGRPCICATQMWYQPMILLLYHIYVSSQLTLDLWYTYGTLLQKVYQKCFQSVVNKCTKVVQKVYRMLVESVLKIVPKV